MRVGDTVKITRPTTLGARNLVGQMGGVHSCTIVDVCRRRHNNPRNLITSIRVMRGGVVGWLSTGLGNRIERVQRTLWQNKR